jgi:hypothetical protein
VSAVQKAAFFLYKKYSSLNKKSHTTNRRRKKYLIGGIIMKKVIPVSIPLETVLEGLRSSEPRYILVEGVRVNLYEVAESVIKSSVRNEEDSSYQCKTMYEKCKTLVKSVDNLIPIIRRIMDEASGFDPYDDDFDGFDDILLDPPDAEDYPEAFVITSLVKFETA